MEKCPQRVERVHLQSFKRVWQMVRHTLSSPSLFWYIPTGSPGVWEPHNAVHAAAVDQTCAVEAGLWALEQWLYSFRCPNSVWKDLLLQRAKEERRKEKKLYTLRNWSRWKRPESRKKLCQENVKTVLSVCTPSFTQGLKQMSRWMGRIVRKERSREKSVFFENPGV